MKKNSYNFPRRASNSNNTMYNQYVEDMYFEEDTTGTLETYNNWWEKVQEIVKEILLSEGDEE